jgi:MFS family permease
VTSPQGSTEPPYPRPAYAWYVVGVLFVAYTFSFIDRQILNLLVEPIRADLGLSDTQISLLQGLAFALFYTTLGVPIGWLADVSSRRTVIMTGVAVWSLMTAACGLAQSFRTLFIARLGVGVGETALSPAAYSLLSDYFPPDKVTRAIAVYTGGSLVGAGLAYIIGGAVIEMVNRMGGVTLPGLGHLRPWQFAFIAVGLPGVLLAALLGTVREPPRRGLTSGAGAAESRMSFAATLRFLYRHRTVYTPHFLGTAMMVMYAYGILAWTPTLFIRNYDWSPSEIGLGYGLVVLIVGTGSVMGAGWMADALRARGHADANMRVTAIGGLALLPIGVAAPLMPTAWLALLATIPVTFLLSLPHGTAPAALQSITPNRMRAQVSAIYLLVTNLIGLGLGPTGVALLTDYVFRDEFALPYSLAVLAAVTGPLCAALLWSGLAPYRARVAELGGRTP